MALAAPVCVAAAAAARHYRCHGLEIVAHGELELASGRGAAPDLAIEADPAAPLPGELLSRSPHTGFGLHREPGTAGCTLLRGARWFTLAPARIGVGPDWPQGADREYLLQRVLPLWLHLHGRPPLHGAAIGIAGDVAIGLLARSGGGKSTLAAALVAAGQRLLGDDVLPLHFDGSDFLVHRGEASLRLWPDSARRWLADLDGLPRVQPDGDKRRVRPGLLGTAPLVAADTALPLGALYVLARGAPDAPIGLERLAPIQALLHLQAHGQMTGPAELLGLGAQRLQLFARLLQQVPVLRLHYPADYARLPEVAAALVAHAGR